MGSFPCLQAHKLSTRDQTDLKDNFSLIKKNPKKYNILTQFSATAPLTQLQYFTLNCFKRQSSTWTNERQISLLEYFLWSMGKVFSFYENIKCLFFKKYPVVSTEIECIDYRNHLSGFKRKLSINNHYYIYSINVQCL